MSRRPSLLGLALPILLAQFAKRVISVTDALWLGTLDLEAINAVATAISFEIVPFFVAFAFSQGMFPDIARARESGDRAQLVQASSRSLSATFAFGVATAAAIWLCPWSVHAMAGFFPSVDSELLYQYIKYSSLGYPAAYANVLLIFLLASENKTRAVTVNYLACCVVNFVLDYYACTRLDDIGQSVAGLALASTVCRVMTFFVLWRLVRVRPRLHIKYLAGWHRLLGAGIPFTLMKLSVVASSIIALLVIEPHGEAYFASFNLTERLFEIVMAVFIGLEGALLYRLSACDPDERTAVYREYARVSLGVTLAFVALVLALPTWAMTSWLGDDVVAVLFRQTLLVKALSIPFIAFMTLAQTQERMAASHMRSSVRVLLASAVKLAFLGATFLYIPSYWAALAVIYMALPCVEPLVYRVARARRINAR